MTSQTPTKSGRRWTGTTLDNFRHPDRLDRREWTSALTQWDIPALFGADPMGITPMQVKLEKIGGGATNRLLGAHAAAGIAALGLSLMGHHNVRIMSVKVQRMAPLCAYGVCVLPYSEKSRGLIVPAFAPRSIGSKESREAGWLPPDSSSDHSAMVPRWALAMAAYCAAIVDPEWVGIAAISPYFAVTRYITPIDRSHAVQIAKKAATWFREQMATEADPGVIDEMPRMLLEDESVPATGEVVALIRKIQDLQDTIGQQQQRADELRQELLAMMGNARRFIDQKTGAVLADVVQGRSSWLPINPSPSGREIVALRNLASEVPGPVTLRVHDPIIR